MSSEMNGRKEVDDFYKAQIAEYKAKTSISRHEVWKTFFVCFFGFLILGSAIGGCTIYNVEQLKHPVEYERNIQENYQRSND